MVITFIGHRTVYEKQELSKRVENVIKDNVKSGETISFYCGGYGDFDELCTAVCRLLKKQFLNCEIIFVTPYMTESQQEKIKYLTTLKLYDGTVYPPIETVPPRFAILKRNEWMIDHSDLVIAYVKRKYGGAYTAYEYAIKKKKVVLNLAEQ